MPRCVQEEGYDEEDSGSEEMDEEAVDDEEDFDGTEVKDVDLAKIKYLLKVRRGRVQHGIARKVGGGCGTI